MFPRERAVYLQEAMRWMVGQTYVCTKTLHRLLGLDLGGLAPPGASVVAALRLSVHRGARRRPHEVVEESPSRGSVDGRECVLDVR